ncbi:MAG TPA: DNA polymerase III subunit alpha [Bacteroidota bacterium]|nr:DNA polymerase III subunit alpha [Bacteroidota bacterium]
MPQFIHLHNHTHYSLLDGATTVDSLLNAALEHKMPAVALTDHGVMSGAIEFYKKAKKKGIKPIIGSEFYIVTKGSRFDKGQMAQSDSLRGEAKSKGRGVYHHLVLLAKNEKGYRNLLKLTTLAHTEGFYYKPRIDFELLTKYHEGVLALSACANGVVAAHLVNENYNEARNVAVMYKELLGEDFYLEIQNHSMDVEKNVLAGMPRLSKELGISLIATNDVHYIKPDHAVAHNIMLLIPDASSTNVPDISKLRYGTDQIYFKSAEEMSNLFKEYPESIENTLEVAEKCNLELDLKTNYMPKFPIPPEAGVSTLEDYLDKLAWEGLRTRFPEITPAISARMTHELGVIRKMGYAGYFLIVADFIRAARAMGVMVGPGRGSAAGSIASYALGITSVDPLKYDLLFERFLNPDRISMPDIDVDFSDNKREKVISYVRDKYGEESVSQIITFGTLSSRAVLKDVARVLGIPLSVVEPITKQIPVNQGKVMPIAEALETVPELKSFGESKDPKIQMLIEVSKVLEGMNRNASMHAAGVVIAPAAISDFVPMYKTPSTDLMTQYTMKDLEDAGLLKMDFLGLRTLTVLETALELIAKNHGVTIDLDALPEEDQKTFELFHKGQTVAVFQFESSGMQDWLRKLRPTSISDLVAMNALYRPGPMENIGDFIKRKHGLQKIEYLHPRMEETLKETYGVIVYQEQVMRIASDIAGYTLAEADLMRRAMGKKDKAAMAAQKTKFVEGAKRTNNISQKLAEEIYDLIEKFASYGFNKSHSVAYSVVAYQTAYLKAHYPAEYMAATLTSEIGNTDKIVLLIDDCRKMGIEVLPPDVNESETYFSVSHNGIRFGMAGIKNVGVNAVDAIIHARADGKKFSSLFEFCQSVDLHTVSKKTIESLILAGAFDSLNKNRAQMFAAVEQTVAAAQNAQAHTERGQSSLFDSGSSKDSPLFAPSMPAVPMWPESEKLSNEKGVLGFYVSGHPLLKYESEINSFATLHLGDVEGVKNGVVRAGGIIASVKKKIDKNNRTMAFITLEDFTGKAECVVFSSLYKKHEELIVPESMVFVEGNGEVSGDVIKIVATDIVAMDKVREKFAKRVFILVNADEVDAGKLSSLRQLIEKNKGNCNCYFNVIGSEFKGQQMFVSRRYSVSPSDQFMDAVKTIMGQNSVKVLA